MNSNEITSDQYSLSHNSVDNLNLSHKSEKSKKSQDKRDKIISEISKKDGIRSIKPEYRIILDTLQMNSPIQTPDLLKEINDTYECEIFTYKQLWANLKSLSDLGAIKNDDLTKEISINPEHILYPETLPISSYCVYLFSISAIFLIISIVTNTFVNISTSIFSAGTLYLLGQHFGSKFSLGKM